MNRSDLPQRNVSCPSVEGKPDDVEQVVACFCEERFITAWSFIAMSGPGSATGVVTSMLSSCALTAPILRSVAVSWAQA